MMLPLECVHVYVCIWEGSAAFCFPLVVTVVSPCTSIGFQGTVDSYCQTVCHLDLCERTQDGGRGPAGLTLTSRRVPCPDLCHGRVSRKLQILLRLQCYSVVQVQKPGRFQHRIWEKGCLSSSSALGLCLASTKMQLMKSRAWSEVRGGSRGLVGWVAILNMAAMASYSAHGGFSVSISTTVQPRLLWKKGMIVFSLMRSGVT